MIATVLSSLLPIFLIIGLGAVLRTSQFMPPGFFAGLNRLAFYVGLPVLLFSRIATSTIESGPALRILWVLLAATALVVALAYVCARRLRLDGGGRGAFVQAALRGNLAYIGLPVILYAMAGDSPAASQIETTAMLVLAPLVPIYNIVSIIVLTKAANHPEDRPGAMALLGRILGNPLLVACLLGLAVAVAGISLPSFLLRTMRPLGQMALPLALLAIGAALTRESLRGRFAPSFAASVLKVVAAPALGWLLGRLFSLPADELRMAMIFLACPTAVTSYVMAQQLGGDEGLAGSSVVLSTLLSFFALTAVLLLPLSWLG